MLARLLGFTVSLLALLPAPARASSSDADAAIRRALPLLQKSAATFVSQRTCMSCHHNALAIMALRLANAHGYDVDGGMLGAVEAITFKSLRGPTALDDAVQTQSLGDPTPNSSYLLMAAHAAGLAPDLTTGVFARHLLSWQRDGHWTTSDFRPPHSSSIFAATASAIRALQVYLPGSLAGERDAAVARARAWLAAAQPRSTEDASFRVMGLAWSLSAKPLIETATRDLLARQRADGGWPQLPGYAPDAYSTGEAVFALREAGVAAGRLQSAIAFLTSTQAADGSWHVGTRMLSPAEVSPPYFTTGFPYEKDEYISYAGSCWAVMALLSVRAESPTRDGAPPPAPAAGAPADWIQTALFGSASELRARVDGGLDPNQTTENGSTALMMAAPEPEKVRLLLARGANPKARAKNGTDALIVAASHGGTTASVQQLLDAGAEPQPPSGVRVRRSALVAASMAGDVDNVRLLLARGAKPSAEALSEAITFGRTAVARMLIAAGADAHGTDGSGINLLHWAVITNRPTMIPLLARAGVGVNDQDQSGFTPLMYAATIDFGDTAALRALLAAGAKRTLRNNDGRTPLQQARFYNHTQLAAVLSTK